MKGKGLFLILGICLSMMGCATYADIRTVQDDLVRIEEKINLLHKRLKIEPPPMASEDMTLKNQARILTEIEGLREELQTIKGRLEESNHQLAALSRQLEVLQTRVAGAPSTETSPTPEPTEPSIPSGTASTPPSTLASVPPETIYQTAYNDYIKGNYALAILGFKEFLNRFPQDTLAPNAQYWLGECYYSLKDFETAIREFERVVNDYPQSAKAPGSLLKIGYSLIELKRLEEAKARLTELLVKYPNSPEADQARDRLQRLESP